MLSTLNSILLDKYSIIFNRTDRNAFLIRKRLRCHNGWFNLVDMMLGMILTYETNKLLDVDYIPVTILDIKEKFGRLTITYDDGDTYIDGIIQFAERASLGICESCGTNKSSVLGYTDKWITVLCKDCYDKDENFQKQGNFISDSILNHPLYNLDKQLIKHLNDIKNGTI